MSALGPFFGDEGDRELGPPLYLSSRAPEREGRDPLRVLVVEDNPGDLDLVTEYLSEGPEATFDIRGAQSLKEAIALLSAEPVDAIILDLNLPDSRGIDTLVEVKRAGHHAPVVVVSGQVDDSLRAAALANGADEVFAKSESRTRLVSLLYVIERSRARSEQRELEKVLTATPDAILVVTRFGLVRYVNEAALVLFDRRREELVGSRLDFRLDRHETSELTLERRGETRHCEVRVVKIEWWRERVLLATLRDITEQRRMETQLAVSDRMVTIGTLAAGIGHEINNPLTAVIANLDFALQELADGAGGASKIREDLRDAREGAERIREIVRDLKLFSRSTEETRGPTDVRRVIESTIRLAWNEMRHRARLVKDYRPTPPAEANEARLGQVVLNLLVNAAQAIPEGARDANEIRITTDVDAKGRVRITISDTGSGMSPEQQKRIFTPFFTTKPVGVGTGLGLAICQRIVTSFGGEMSFESEQEIGTRFYVCLPASRSMPTPPPPDPARVASARSRGKILVVDDEPAILQVVKRILGASHDITAVTSAAAGLAALERETFDVILCDVMMPEMTGMDLHAAVKARGGGLEDRIVFMTGGAFTPAARTFLDGVHNHRVEKPFDLQGMRVLVDQLVRAARGAE